MSLNRYKQLKRNYPNLFVNPPGCLHQIIDEESIIKVESNRLGLKVGVVAEDQYFLFLRDLVINPRIPDSKPYTYDRVISKNSLDGTPLVAVLPFVGNKIFLQKIFRHATREFHWEIPRGFGQPGHSPLETAREELESEMGIRAETWTELGGIHSDSGITANYLKVFLAQDDTLSRKIPQIVEGVLKIKAFPIDEVNAMIKGGQITDSITISAICLASLLKLI